MIPISRAALYFSVLIFAALSASGQTSGTITYTPPVAPTPGAAGSVKAVAGTLTCTAVGNGSPATSVVITCIEGSVAVAVASLDPPMNNWSSFAHSDAVGDTITIKISADGSGAITWQATATPAGQTAAAPQTGSL